MKIHVLGSNSSGNGYVFEADNTALVVECGVRLKKAIWSLNFDILKIAGGIVSHCHSDHAGFLDEYINRFPVANNINRHFNSIQIVHRRSIHIGEWTILPLKLEHDVECYGFIINHKECGNIFFATDTNSIPYKLKGLNHVLIEANYTQEELDKKQSHQQIHHFLAKRIENSHLSFEKTVEWLDVIDKSELKTITMIHLSNSNSDSRRYISEIKSLTGIETNIAKKGDIIHLTF